MSYIWRKVESTDDIPILGIWSHHDGVDPFMHGFLRIQSDYCKLNWDMVGVSLLTGSLKGCSGASLALYLYIGEV